MSGERTRPDQDDWGELAASNVLLVRGTAETSARVPKRRFHGPRHCTGSLRLARGIALRPVTEIRVQNQLATILDLYAQVMPSGRRRRRPTVTNLILTVKAWLPVPTASGGRPSSIAFWTHDRGGSLHPLADPAPLPASPRSVGATG